MTIYSSYAEFKGGTSPDGTVITAGNLTAASTLPSGYTTTLGTSGSPTSAFEAPGIDIAGPTSSLSSYNGNHASSLAHAFRCYLEPSANPSATNLLISHRAGGAYALYLNQLSSGALEIRNAASTVITAFNTPTLTPGHLYQIDQVVKRGTTTTDGRAVLRVIDMDSESWATGGVFYYDSGDTINVGTVDLDGIRIGKQTSAMVQPIINLSYFAWVTIASIAAQATANSDPKIARKLFLPPTYGFFEKVGTAELPLDLEEGTNTNSPLDIYPYFQYGVNWFQVVEFTLSGS